MNLWWWTANRSSGSFIYSDAESLRFTAAASDFQVGEVMAAKKTDNIEKQLQAEVVNEAASRKDKSVKVTAQSVQFEMIRSDGAKISYTIGQTTSSRLYVPDALKLSELARLEGLDSAAEAFAKFFSHLLDDHLIAASRRRLEALEAAVEKRKKTGGDQAEKS